MSRRATTFQLFIAASALFTLASVGVGQVLNDPLQGSTIGTRENGAFVTGGWQVTNQYDTIYWHMSPTSHGAFQYNVKGIPGNGCPGSPLNSKNELSHIYDYTFGNADIVYAPGYRDNPYKQFLRKECGSGREGVMEIVFAANGPFVEEDSETLSWDIASDYTFRYEWENAGGNTSIKYYRSGALVWTQGFAGASYSPAGQSVRIAASPRRADEGATTGAIYSYVKAYDLNSYVPPAPAVSVPNNAETVNTQVMYIQWTGDIHTLYQVRCNTSNDPNTGIAWDSQQVSSDRNFTWSGTLAGGTYYAFVRIGTSAGWSGWSPNGRTFTVNTFFTPTGTDFVRVKGNSYANFGGPFLGLGFTYMRSLYNCKYQRARYESDLSFMASKKFNYQRMLSCVDWCGLEIAPITFTGVCGGTIVGWSDYWQQFRDDIDVAYTYGIKTEVTVFGGGSGLNSDSTRIPHLDNILANIVGREHKIVLLEVANESFQTGWGYPFGISDVAAKARYLADRTACPVALSSTNGSDFSRTSAQSGSAADVAVDHFPRDLGEGHWAAVRNSYGLGSIGPIPVSSNEPIGAGSSVATENDPIHLCMAGVFAWTANLVSYVYHSRAGVFGWEFCCPPGGQERFFSASPGVDSYQFIHPLLPKDLSSWARNDGREAASPFTNFCAGQPNKWWTEVGGATDGCDTNISSIKAGRFVTCPIGILGGGLTMQARRPMHFKVYNWQDGSVAYDLTKNANDVFALAQGTGAYVIIGDYTDLPIDPGEGGGGAAAQVSVDLGTTDVENGMTCPQVGDGDTTPANIGGRDCRRNVNPAVDYYMYFTVSDGYAFQGSKPNQFINVDYYDTGTGSLQLQYDGTAGAYVTGPSVNYTNTNTWKTVTWNITDAYFGNRQNAGADFRIFRGVGITFYFDKVIVYQKAFTGTPVSTPGTIEAENFDNGGEDFGYNDADVGNNGGMYRLAENVDIEACAEGGFNVGWVATGEYLNYQVNVASAGSYDFGMRVASGASTTTYHIEMNGVNVTGTRTVTSTGGIQTWATQTISSITLSAGVQTMKLVIESSPGGANFNYITLGKHQGPFGGTARAIPGVIQAEDFDDGGEGVAYHDVDVPNNGGQYRTSESVDITTTTDTGGGYIVGWIDPGEWIEYTVNVNQTGDYAVKIRQATANGAGGAFHLSLNGANIFTAKSFPDTGGWDTWTTVIVPGIFMTAGNNQVLRLTTDANPFNINYLDFAFSGADVVSVDLGNPDVVDGMSHIVCCDGMTQPWSTGGHNARVNTADTDAYYYFEVTDIYAFQGNKNNATITFDYLDKDTGTLILNYDGTSNAYTGGPSIVFTNSNTWKTAVWQVSDAYFGNRENGGADFRIYYSGLDFYIDTVTVFAQAGTPLPGQASNPNPANGATLVNRNADLTWTAGSNATSHDVRFGTANPPPFVINQAGTTYDPGTMAVNTTYFWRIDEKNATGTTTGVVWSFTTLPLPGAASSPSPANGATLVAITTALTWTAGSNAASHDVRFGTANPPPFIQNQAGTSYNPTKSPNTLYYWRIDEVNTSGTTTGTVWSFATLPVPGAASSPSPANGATLVPITTALTWTAGSNAASHDVRFGTANPPPFIQNQAGTSYNPTKSPNTLYYWRIDEVNSSGTTTGTVWSFTTLPVPGAASSPSPANGATLVPITTALTWTAGSNAASHDVRFGTANPPPFIQNQAGTSYNPTKSPNTLYYWRIDEVNSSGTTTGTVWSFTTLPVPGAASSPSPANGATLVAVTAALTWTAGSNAASHDVRFGTANPPPFIQNQAGTSYNPSKSPNTLYYWRIDEVNSSGTTTGTVWSFTTLPVPGAASSPSPANGATGVATNAQLSWTAGSNTTSHDVRFGTANPPPFVVNQAGTTYNPGTLANGTVYYWRIDEINSSGTTTGTVWSFTTVASGPATLVVKNIASALTIDGSSADWNIASFVTKIRGGELGNGDIALVGFDGGATVYRGAFAGGTVLPTNAADHTAKVYSRHDSTYLYFIARLDDNQIQTQNGLAMNWANDCIEFYIDPTNDGGSTPMSNSTSDIQLVVDAINQKNVYMCTAGYTTQVLNGVTSAVTTDGTGWWVEVRIQKSALDGDIPANGTIGLDFNYRDNDNNNDPTLTTVYTWTETSTAGFPSKIPSHWGKASLPVLPAPGLATNPNPANGATGVVATGVTLSWTAGLDATSHGVRFGTANPPPFIQNQAGTTYNTGAMSGSTTYYWRIDEINGSGTTTGTVWSFTTAATGPVTFSNSAFPSNADGWNIVVWKSGPNADGTMAWSSSGGNPTGNMLSGGSGATNSGDNCTREGGEINKLISTTGHVLNQVQYDVIFNTVAQTAAAPCFGGCPSGPMLGDCADKIAVWYSTAGTGGPWTLLESVNADSVTQGVWSTRTINLPTGADNQANFALRFRWQFNTSTDSGRLDNIKVIDLP